jgi:hypothetical protein
VFCGSDEAKALQSDRFYRGQFVGGGCFNRMRDIDRTHQFANGFDIIESEEVAELVGASTAHGFGRKFFATRQTYSKK